MSTLHLSTGSKQPPKIEGRLRLYSMQYCPFSHRVRLVLRAKNVDHDTVNINLLNKPEWYTNVHAEGKVPALDTGSKIIVESLSICDFLDNQYPSPPLYPAEPLGVEQDKDLIQKIEPLVNIFTKIIVGKETKSPAEWKEQMVPHLEIFNTALEKRDTKYFGGENPGMVDYMLWPWAERAGVLAIVLGERLPIETNELSKIRQWRKLMREHPVVDGIYNEPEKFYKSVLIKLGSLPPDYDAI
ncbi:GstO2 [Trypoxylus dichotomus]